MAKKLMYSFEEKRHSGKGIVSTIMGAVSLILVIAMLYVSYYLYGSAGIYAGAFGFSGLIFGLVGFVVGLAGISEKNVSYLFPKLGAVMSGIGFAVWLGIYLAGF